MEEGKKKRRSRKRKIPSEAPLDSLWAAGSIRGSVLGSSVCTY
jgi:hypothetical protein